MFCDYLTKLRLSTKVVRVMSLADLARESGISASYLTQLESGTRKATSVPTLAKLADALHTPLSELISEAQKDMSVQRRHGVEVSTVMNFSVAGIKGRILEDWRESGDVVEGNWLGYIQALREYGIITKDEHMQLGEFCEDVAYERIDLETGKETK